MALRRTDLFFFSCTFSLFQFIHFSFKVECLSCGSLFIFKSVVSFAICWILQTKKYYWENIKQAWQIFPGEINFRISLIFWHISWWIAHESPCGPLSIYQFDFLGWLSKHRKGKRGGLSKLHWSAGHQQKKHERKCERKLLWCYSGTPFMFKFCNNKKMKIWRRTHMCDCVLRKLKLSNWWSKKEMRKNIGIHLIDQPMHMSGILQVA